ncbi:MAG: lipase [Halieaceae bacterium]|nr:lipase [Halieaceae bacterium]
MSLWNRIDEGSKPPLEALWKAIPGGLNVIPDIVARREAMSAARAGAPKGEFPLLRVTEHTYAGPGGDLTLRLYSPDTQDAQGPGLIYIHGGGMIMGDLDSQDENLREAATELNIPIASIDYRKAPEHPYPAAPEDCYAGVCWVFEHAPELGMDTDNIGLMGASAGGGLALATALMLRDRLGPSLKYLLPIYPMIDDRHETASSHEVVDIGIWDRAGSIEAWGWYLGDSEPDAYAAPARAEDLSGLPPTYIDVGDLDLFRDEDIDIAQRLSAAGVPVEFHLWTGAFHASELFAPDAPLSQRIWATRYTAIRRLAGLPA